MSYPNPTSRDEPGSVLLSRAKLPAAPTPARRILQSWDRPERLFPLLTGKDDPHSLAAFRILFGIYLLGYHLPALPDIGLRYGAEGVHASAWAGVAWAPAWLLHGAPAPLAWLLWLALIAACLGLTLGWRSAWLTPLVLVLHTWHALLAHWVRDCSYDRLIVLFLAIACCARLDGAWALRPVRPGQPVPSWPGGLIAIQLAFLYLGTGLVKACNPEWSWWPASARIVRDSIGGTWGTDLGRWLASLPLPDLLWAGATYAVIAFEIGAAVTLWLPRWRLWTCIAGAVLHVGISLTMGIPEFLLCIAAYPLYFPGAEVSAAWTRLTGRG